MKLIFVSIIFSVFLTGCSMYPGSIPGMASKTNAYNPVYTQLPHSHEAHNMVAVSSPWISSSVGRVGQPSLFSREVDDLELVDYVSLMATQLINSSHYINTETALGVASFVPLSNYRQTNAFGLQVAESFVFEMQQKGLSVIDYKSTGFIRITPEGDFVYSREVDELSKRLAIEYLLVGTFSEAKNGVVVNVRIVGARSRVVVASAQQLIPYKIYKNSVDGDPAKQKIKRRDGILTIG
jgi:TolB-like protein